MADFETGAKRQASNDLVLTVLNDGAIYMDRCHAGFAALQGAKHRVSFRDLVSAAAADSRRRFGSKFRLADIAEATRLVQADTLAHCVEAIRDGWDGSPISCHGRKWRDIINGNTYFSARIVVPSPSGPRWFSVPFQYGHGSQWEHECRAVLARIGFPSDAPLDFNFEGAMKKHDMYRGTYL